MTNTFKYGALAALMAAGFSSAALADSAETKGGLTVKTDDGRFEMKLGGRFHFDTYVFDEDLPNTTEGGMFMRRGYLTTTGKLYDWKYKHEFDLAASGTASATWRDAWVSTQALGGEIVIGQFKPYRSMEELTSSNEILMMERPFSSATGLYAGRQFQMGLGYKLPFSSGMWALSVVNLHAIGGATNEGVGVSTRLTFTPVNTEGSVVHLGLSAGQDNGDAATYTNAGVYAAGTPVGPGSVTIAGRNSGTQVTSPTLAIGTAAIGESQDTIGLEAAAAIGPFFIQAEAAQSTLTQVAGAVDQDVLSYYVQSSIFFTGETKPYKADRGTFGTPKPNGESGAWELAARYDVIENKDLATQPEITSITAGLNWYVNPNVRFMLNYTVGSGETATAKNEPNAIALRTQLSF